MGYTGVDRGDADALPAAERALVVDAGELRRRQFAAGRVLARQALYRIGHPLDALGRRDDGSPDWPDGVCGSLSHTAGLALAVAGPRTHIASIGVDIEPLTDFPAAAVRTVFTAAERARLCADDQRLASFSAKESVYKCLAPLGAVDLDFLDVEVCWQTDRFDVRPATPGAIDPALITAVRGRRFTLGEGRYIATVAIIGPASAR
ncbi:4'-phosphopantetheinyl transferase entD [Salinisphaera sp. T31B1]